MTESNYSDFRDATDRTQPAYVVAYEQFNEYNYTRNGRMNQRYVDMHNGYFSFKMWMTDYCEGWKNMSKIEQCTRILSFCGILLTFFGGIFSDNLTSRLIAFGSVIFAVCREFLATIPPNLTGLRPNSLPVENSNL